jgi:hypothetical protein
MAMAAVLRYPARMTERAPERPAEKLVIEFPEDPDHLELPEADELHATVETQEPPDTHSIRERWARLADVGGGW